MLHENLEKLYLKCEDPCSFKRLISENYKVYKYLENILRTREETKTTYSAASTDKLSTPRYTVFPSLC